MWRLASVLLAVAVAAQQQQQPPVFRSGTQIVEVDARVFDRDGRFVADLTREDFEIIENGVPQRIETVVLVGAGTPATTSSPRPTTNTAGPATPSVPTTPSHTWIFYFDLNHLSSGSGFDRAKRAVEEFVTKTLADGHLAGVVAGDRMVNNRLTSVRADLIAAVRSVKPNTEGRSLTQELREWPRFRDREEALEVAQGTREVFARVVSRARAECTDCPAGFPIEDQVRSKAERIRTLVHRMSADSLSALTALASGLAKMAGPKTVVLLSDGIAMTGLESSVRGTVGQLARAGARVYGIDVRGLSRGLGGDVEQAYAAPAESAPPSFDSGVDSMNSISVDTGGMLIRNDNNIGRALDTVASHASTYYVIAYQPSNTSFDGKFRSIEVKVKRPGVRVRARRGYLALEPAKMLVPAGIRR